jgi:hypothetical protein
MATPKLIKAEHLKIDPPIVIKCDKREMIQKHAVMSFVAPMDRIKMRFMFEANRFLYHDVNKQIIDTTINVTRDVNTAFKTLLEKKIATYKTSSDPIYKASAELLESTMKELQLNEDEQCTKVLRAYKQDQQELLDRFETYKIQNDKVLEADFNEKYTDQTSVMGFKFRGAYEDYDVACKQVEFLQKNVEPHIHTFVAPAGYWCPFNPNADAVQNQEYMVPELNRVVGGEKQNAEQREEFFAKRKQMMIDDVDQTHNKELHNKLRQRLQEQKQQRTRK